MEWLRESWLYLVSWGGTVGAVIFAIRAVYAAERDRQALRQADLEREKLTLEIARLRNSPEIVADRRAIYNRLRSVMSEITRDAAVTISHINKMHEVRHDAEYRFPPDIVASIRELIRATVDFHVSGEVLKGGPNRISAEAWQKQVATNHDALTVIATFESNMVEKFRPHLSL